MTFPAWFDLNRDREIAKKPAAQRVYAHLIETYPRIFFDPIDAKAWLIADELGLERETVGQALAVLCDRGYLLEHGRAPRNIRRVTIALTRRVQS